MALRAATDSGIVVFPPLPLPKRHSDVGARSESASTKDSRRTNWRLRIALATTLLAAGFAAGFIARLRLMPPAELGQRRSEVTALLLQQQQRQTQLADAETQVAALTTQLATSQTKLSQANDQNQALAQTQLTLANAASAQRARYTELARYAGQTFDKRTATITETASGVVVRFPDIKFFAGAGVSEAPTANLTVMVGKLRTMLAGATVPIASVTIRSSVRPASASAPVPARRGAPPAPAPVDAWTQSALRAGSIAAMLRNQGIAETIELSAAGGGPVGARAASVIEVTLTLRP
jgi:hypothetical protein